MSEPWNVVKLKSFSSPEKPSPLVVFEIGQVTGGMFSEAKRVYMVTNDSEKPDIRGGHRHPPGGKLEFLICTKGAMTIELHHPARCGTVRLASPVEALVFCSDTWHQVTLEPGSQLLSVASTNYDPKEALPDKLCECHRTVRSPKIFI